MNEIGEILEIWLVKGNRNVFKRVFVIKKLKFNKWKKGDLRRKKKEDEMTWLLKYKRFFFF